AFALLGLRLRLSMVRALIDINAQRLQVLARSPRLCTDDLGFPGITGTLAFFHNYGAVAQPLEHGARRDASWEGLSPPRARNPLFRRISPLFRLQRRFSVNTLNLRQFWREELRRTRPVWRNPLFLPLLPANPAGWISPSARPSAARRALQTAS